MKASTLDGQHTVTCQIEVQERGEAGTDEHESLIEAVHRVVDIVAVDGTLAVVDAGQGAVQRVAIPVDNHAEGTEPEPLDAVVGKDKADGHNEGTEGAQGGEHVRRDPAGLPLGQPYKGFLFKGVDYGGLDALRLLHDGLIVVNIVRWL